MTDEQVARHYAIARDSFAGGQREIQLQSYPFHMTAENMAKFRLDPNIDFWKKPQRRLRPFRGHQKRAIRPGLRQALCLRRDHERRGYGQRTVAPLSSRSKR